MLSTFWDNFKLVFLFKLTPGAKLTGFGAIFGNYGSSDIDLVLSIFTSESFGFGLRTGSYGLGCCICGASLSLS